MTSDKAFSGLEAAIVLIAFVVVAAVFSYVMLGAGFFATQKSQEVTYSGIKQATSNMVVDGSLYGTLSGANLKYIDFTLAIPQGGQPQNLNIVDYGFTIQGKKIQYSTAPAATLAANNFGVGTSGSNGDIVSGTILKAGGKANMRLTVGTGTTGPIAGQTFTVEVRPNVGASSLLTKKLATGYTGGAII